MKAHADALAAATKDDSAYAPLVKLDPATSTGRRLALAKWIADAKNPLTARVAVNHVWMRHLGTPLVASVANFGLSGDKSTHPELLDWLAADFRDQGGSLKALHRRIVTSDTYRQTSTGNAAAEKIDAGNTLLWRQNRRRLEAEDSKRR